MDLERIRWRGSRAGTGSEEFSEPVQDCKSWRGVVGMIGSELQEVEKPEVGKFSTRLQFAASGS